MFNVIVCRVEQQKKSNVKDRCLKIPAKHVSPWLWTLLTHRMLPLPLIVAFGCVLEMWLNRFKCSASQIVDTCLRLTMKAWTVGLKFKLKFASSLHLKTFSCGRRARYTFSVSPAALFRSDSKCCFDFCNLYVIADNKINEWTLRWHAAAMVMNETEWDGVRWEPWVLIWCEQHRIRFQLLIWEVCRPYAYDMPGFS